MNTQEKEYAKFIDSLNLRHFKGREFVAYARRRNSGGQAGVPPRHLWKSIVPTIQVIDQLRAYYGKAITITSAYRSPGYNKACGGVKASQHMKFTALDIQVSGIRPHVIFNRLKRWRDAGVFKGGLGKYSTFVHIDTRGSNSTWG